MRRRLIATGLGAALAAAALALPATGSALAPPHPDIVGGAPAPAGTFPWLAFVVDDEGSQYGLCSGTVVAPNVVLTAAHCVLDATTGAIDPAANFAVVTGSLDWTDEAARQTSAVSQVLLYPGFQAATLYGDAALLVLASPTSAPAIALATSADAGLYGAGSTLAIAGWGDTVGGQQSEQTALQWGTVTTQAANACALADGQDGLAFDPSSELCALDAAAAATGPCHGDSGGPAIALPATATPIEVGITSRGDGACNTAVPSIYTRTDLISPWVEAQIAAVSPSAAPATATATATAAGPSQPQAGRYAGRHLELTLAAPGVTRLHLEWRFRCPHGRRGPYVETSAWTSDPIALTQSGGVWRFTARYSDARHVRYSVTGAFTTPTTATGTLSVTGRGGACASGTIRWTAGLAA